MQDSLSYLPVFALTHQSAESRGCCSGCCHKQVIARLVACGLLVATVEAVVDGGGGCLVHVGDDAPVLNGRHAGSQHYRYQGAAEDLFFRLVCLARSVDLILVKSDRDLGLPGLSEFLDLHACRNNPEDAVQRILEQLQQKLAQRPVWACILIGGRSSRMGRPKHLLSAGTGLTWLERTVRTVQPCVSGLVLSGRGEVPNELQSLIRLPDIPDVSGPLTGILSAMRWQPDVSWLLLACDMPELTPEAVSWLLAQKKVGQWGSVPALAGRQGVEPLFARYEPQCAALFEQMSARGTRRISNITDFNRVKTIQVPEHLHHAWQNVNTPEELARSVS